MRKLKGVLDSGAIGRPTWGRIVFRTGYDIYVVQPYLHQAQRYAILDVGIHLLDLAHQRGNIWQRPPGVLLRLSRSRLDLFT